MDALALLCTLHADGPTTLARLRRAECTSLEHVIAHPTERVARWMRVDVAVAERFQREARALYDRIGSEVVADARGVQRATWNAESDADAARPTRARAPLARPALGATRAPNVAARARADAFAADVPYEHEETAGDRDTVFDREHARALAFDEQAGNPAESEPSAASTAAEGRDVPARPRAVGGRDEMMRRVLETWRERDEAETTTEADVDDVPAALPVPVTQLPAIPTHRIDGLDAECSLRLAKVGIGTIDALARCDALAIARATSMPFARVLRLRALARRVNALSPDVGAASVAVEVEVDAPAPPPRASPLARFGTGAELARAAARADASPPVGSESELVTRGRDRDVEEHLSPSDRPYAERPELLARALPPVEAELPDEGVGGPFA